MSKHLTSIPLQPWTILKEYAANLASTFPQRSHTPLEVKVYRTLDVYRTPGTRFGPKTLVHQCLKIYTILSSTYVLKS